MGVPEEEGLGFRVWGLGFGVWGLGFRVCGLGCPKVFVFGSVRVTQKEFVEGVFLGGGGGVRGEKGHLLWLFDFHDETWAFGESPHLSLHPPRYIDSASTVQDTTSTLNFA